MASQEVGAFNENEDFFCFNRHPFGIFDKYVRRGHIQNNAFRAMIIFSCFPKYFLLFI